MAKERGDRGAMLAAYRQASQILDTQLLPAAVAFARVNEVALEQRYREAEQAARYWRPVILRSGLGLILTLLVLQVFLTRRTRRLLNPLLLLATVIASLFVTHTLSLMSSAETLSGLKEDVYEPIRMMRLGRVQLYQADGAKSRSLLDRERSAQHQTAFDQHLAQILQLPDPTALSTVIQAFQTGQVVSGSSGYFAESLRRATSAEEQAVLLKMLQDYDRYLQIDRQIRNLTQSGQLKAAIALSTGRNPDQSQWDFDQLLAHNEKARDLYTNRFEQVSSSTIQSLDSFEAKAAVSVTAIALLILFGLRLRLREDFL